MIEADVLVPSEEKGGGRASLPSRTLMLLNCLYLSHFLLLQENSLSNVPHCLSLPQVIYDCSIFVMLTRLGISILFVLLVCSL